MMTTAKRILVRKRLVLGGGNAGTSLGGTDIRERPNGALRAGPDAFAATLTGQSPVDVDVTMTEESNDSQHVPRACGYAPPARTAERRIDLHERGSVVAREGQMESKSPGDCLRFRSQLRSPSIQVLEIGAQARQNFYGYRHFARTDDRGECSLQLVTVPV